MRRPKHTLTFDIVNSFEFNQDGREHLERCIYKFQRHIKGHFVFDILTSRVSQEEGLQGVLQF